jgi:hypothetical protein
MILSNETLKHVNSPQLSYLFLSLFLVNAYFEVYSEQTKKQRHPDVPEHFIFSSHFLTNASKVGRFGNINQVCNIIAQTPTTFDHVVNKSAHM